MASRNTIRSLVLGLAFGGLAFASGCGDDMKETGGTVQATADDLKSMEASAAAYKAESKQPKAAAK